MKTCTLCDELKPLDAFRRGQGYKGGVRSNCKACEAERLRRWRANHPEQHRAQTKRHNDKARVEGRGYWDPDKRDIFNMQRRDRYLQRKYGITLDEYVARVEAQTNRCAACCGPPTSSTGKAGQGHKLELVVDHCHETGAVRGLLCGSCNSAAGYVGDDPARLRALADYLEGGSR